MDDRGEPPAAVAHRRRRQRLRARDQSMIVVLTHFPSPYQLELFNEIERQQHGAVKVLYLYRRANHRRWTGSEPAHAHLYLEDAQAMDAATREVERADFVVFNYYRSEEHTSELQSLAYLVC